MSKPKRSHRPAPALAQDDLGLLLALQLLAEFNMARDPSDDGSAVFGRAMGLLGSWRELGEGGKEALRLRRLIGAAEPLLSRTARAIS
jgi:hypothetical protein